MVQAGDRATLQKRESDPPIRDQGDEDLKSAQYLRNKARRLKEQAEAMLQEATVLQKAAEDLEALEEKRGPEREETDGLPVSENTGTVEGMNTADSSHALKVARGKAKDALAKAAVNHGMTQGEMVEAVRRELKLKKLPLSGISQARRGTRPIRRDVVEAIERLTGFKASRANWPGGIREVPSTSGRPD
jgi:hypothetical protein